MEIKNLVLCNLTAEFVTPTLRLMKYLHDMRSDFPFDEEWKEQWLSKFLSSGDGFIILASTNNVIGYLIGEKRTEEYSKSSYGYIREIFVAENDRREHVGKCLINEAKRRFSQYGCRSIRLHFSANSKLVAFYEATGFSPFRTEFICKL